MTTYLYESWRVPDHQILAAQVLFSDKLRHFVNFIRLHRVIVVQYVRNDLVPILVDVLQQRGVIDKL